MGDRLEARIDAIENIQEEFGHDIREIKEQLARLTSLLEDDIRTAPTPRPKAFDAPSKYIFQSSSSRDSSFSICNTAIKSSSENSKLMGSLMCPIASAQFYQVV